MNKQKHTERQFCGLPACAAEFIKLVVKKMRYRKKVRRDVQAELAAHFEDELKDCTTDEEKEQKAQQLIGQFGDVKLLAVLLRRAKKRCRPLWRTIVTRTFRTVGVSILFLTAYMVWFLTGKPAVTVDYVAELNRIVRPVADESLNTAPLYTKAAELVEESLDRDTRALLGRRYEQTTAEEKLFIEQKLKENAEALALIVAGAKKPYYWREYGNEENPDVMMAILLPHLSEFRTLARALCWRAWLRAEQGRYEDAFDDMKACYRFGRHLRGDKSLIEQLVGIAIEKLATQTLLNVLSEYKIDSAKLAKLQRDFEQIIADENFTVSFNFEKLSMYDEIQRCFTEDRLGGGHLYLRRAGGLAIGEELAGTNILLHILFTHPNKQETREMIDRYYGFWDKMVHKSPAQIRTEGIDTEKEAMQIIKDNLFLGMLVPAIGRVIEIGYRIKADVESTLTIIAILRHRQDTGNYPESLDNLVVAGYLKHLPMDPWSDKPLVYKRTDDGFMLYGVGSNFKDDGGQVFRDDKGRVKKYADEGDWVFWPVPKSEIKQ